MKRLLVLTVLLALSAAAPWLSASAPVPNTGPHAEGRRYALLIGVDTYDDARAIKRTQNLSFAARDAQVLGETLRSRGFASGDVVVMSTNAARNDALYPTAANIRRQLRVLTARLRESDTVVVHFSGYEMQFARDDDYYLCPTDADAADLHSLVSLREACAALDSAPAAGKLVIVDSCRTLEKKQGGPVALRLPARSVGILFACSAGQSAGEVPEKRQGVLSWFLAEGLRGAADSDKDGVVTARELVAYAQRSVPAYINGQDPELLGRLPSILFAALDRPAGNGAAPPPPPLPPGGVGGPGCDESQTDASAAQKFP